MEKALMKVSSLKAGGFWISSKAKEELSNITQDITYVSNAVEEKAKWVFNKLKDDEWVQEMVWKGIDELMMLSGLLNTNLRLIPQQVTLSCMLNCGIFGYNILVMEMELEMLRECIRIQANQDMALLASRKPVKTLPNLLQEYNLPPGLFPQNITCYEFDATKAKLTVYFPSACEVSFSDSSVIRYATRVKGTLLRGKLTGIEGMKTKVLVWVKVTSIAVEDYKSDKVWFTAGMKKSRAKDAYEMAQDAVRVKEF